MSPEPRGFYLLLLDESKDHTILSNKQSIQQYTNLNICTHRVLEALNANHFTTNSRRSGLVQSLHYLVCNSGGLLQILIELFISTISLRALPKCIKWSTWPVGHHQPEYMSHVLSGGQGDVPFKAFKYFMKPPRQHERFVFIPLCYLHKARHVLSSILHISKLFEVLLHQVSGF